MASVNTLRAHNTETQKKKKKDCQDHFTFPSLLALMFDELQNLFDE